MGEGTGGSGLMGSLVARAFLEYFGVYRCYVCDGAMCVGYWALILPLRGLLCAFTFGLQAAGA